MTFYHLKLFSPNTAKSAKLRINNILKQHQLLFDLLSAFHLYLHFLQANIYRKT